MIRIHPPRALIALVVLLLAATVGAGQAAGYDNVTGTASPTDSTTPAHPNTTSPVLASDSLTANQSRADSAVAASTSSVAAPSSDSSASSPLRLVGVSATSEWDPTSVDRSPLVGPETSVDAVGVMERLATVDQDGSPIPASPQTVEDEAVATSSDEPEQSPRDPESHSSDGLPMSVGVGGMALAVALRRGAVVSGLGVLTPLSAVQSPRAVLDRLIRLVYPLRYSRFDDSDPLEHDTRRQVHRVVEREPGTYLSAVSERAGVPLSTARHHVRVLEREGMVASAKVRGKRRFYPSGADEVELVAAIDDGATASVLDALARLGPCSVAVLAEDLGRDSSTVTYHLQRLEEDGLVERERDGRSVENRLSDAVQSALAPDEAESRMKPMISSPADD